MAELSLIPPPIQHPMLGSNGLVTVPWASYFRSLAIAVDSGYMLKSVYDPGDTGSVVDSDELNGQPGSYYLDLSNHTGSLSAQLLSWNVRVMTASATAVAGDFCDVDASGGAVSVTLPSVGGNVGRMIAVSKADSSANAVTIIGTVNGTVNPTLTVQYTCALMVSNGTEWRRLA